MARLWPLLLLFGVFFVLIALLRRYGGPPRSGTTDGTSYRPRPAAGGAPRSVDAADGAPLVMRCAELAGLRDAYSSAPIDAAQPLHACARCQALVHGASLQVLRESNHGRCPVCQHRGFRSVHVIDA